MNQTVLCFKYSLFCNPLNIRSTLENISCLRIVIVPNRVLCNVLCLSKSLNRSWINVSMNYLSTGGFESDDYGQEKGNKCSVSFNCWLARFYTKDHKISNTCSSMQSSTLATREREERDTNLLNSVRYYEHVCSPEQHYINTGKNRMATLKVMSYNVLSQTLLEDHRYLYKNSNPTTLKWQYRFPRLLSEIIHHNPDILCLQEVQQDHLMYFNKLENYGYVSVYKKRTGDKVDGCSIYYKANLFSLITLSEVEYFRPGIKELNRDNVGLIVRLFWWNGNRHVSVANTHLLYNPRRMDIRLAQISLLLSELNTLTEFGCKSDLVFLAGDLNSYPQSKVSELITQGRVDFCSLNFSINSRLLTTHNFKFKSAYDHYTEDDTEASTNQNQWVTADYIYYSSKDQNLCLSTRFRLPTTKDCKRAIRKLPNFASSSDHLPLVATFLYAID